MAYRIAAKRETSRDLLLSIQLVVSGIDRDTDELRGLAREFIEQAQREGHTPDELALFGSITRIAKAIDDLRDALPALTCQAQELLADCVGGDVPALRDERKLAVVQA